ncbi:hypothetical protein GBF35_19440 [Nonomuraea phyllanthi]|uniref:hypothetical protein n=1 Tax=Nonomuraea phyllanthi TaxID=2219224 RepID=UPI00129324D7|nr:hypothetical protein [Nonomuraea phyllanthi]QFY08559.1 hypothetical protein GBF35_19440 [Nonomuraea phyllanthi]
MAGPRLIPCVLALATLTLGACSSSLPSPTGGESRVSGVAGGDGEGAPANGGGTRTSTPSPTALTAEAYKSELESRHKSMARAIDAVAGARGVKSLDSKVTDAEEELSGAAEALAALAPPDAVRAQHDAYVASLRDFATELGSTAGKVGARDLCTSSAVLADLDDKLAALDKAGEALQSAGDYPADIVDVKAGKKRSRRLGNGSFVRRSALNGRSSLQIDNGGSRDAVVTLIKGRSKAFSVYVRKNGKFKVKGVPDGTYKIYFTHGVDWDGKSKSFTRECSFEKFQKSVKFKTTYTATQILWHDWRITLHTIAGGNARTSAVDPDDFPS